jgi:four helix bundle protein
MQKDASPPAPRDLRLRTKEFALRVIRMVQALPRNRVATAIGGQVLRSGTSVGANYRSACRARSQAEFISRMHIVLEEADESHYWMELLVASHLVPERRLSALMKETEELVAIAVASINTARKKEKPART